MLCYRKCGICINICVYEQVKEEIVEQNAMSLLVGWFPEGVKALRGSGWMPAPGNNSYPGEFIALSSKMKRACFQEDEELMKQCMKLEGVPPVQLKWVGNVDNYCGIRYGALMNAVCEWEDDWDMGSVGRTGLEKVIGSLRQRGQMPWRENAFLGKLTHVSNFGPYLTARSNKRCEWA